MPSESLAQKILGEDHSLIIKDYFRDLCVTVAVVAGMSGVSFIVDWTFGDNHEKEKFWTHEFHGMVFISIIGMLAMMTGFRVLCITLKSLKKSWEYTKDKS